MYFVSVLSVIVIILASARVSDGELCVKYRVKLRHVTFHHVTGLAEKAERERNSVLSAEAHFDF